MAIYKCKVCGGDLDINEETDKTKCSYCGSEQTISLSTTNTENNLNNSSKVLSVSTLSEISGAMQNLHLKCEAIPTEKAEKKKKNPWGIIFIVGIGIAIFMVANKNKEDSSELPVETTKSEIITTTSIEVETLTTTQITENMENVLTDSFAEDDVTVVEGETSIIKAISYNDVPIYSYLGENLSNIKSDFSEVNYSKFGDTIDGKTVYYCSCDDLWFVYTEDDIIIGVSAYSNQAVLMDKPLNITAVELINDYQAVISDDSYEDSNTLKCTISDTSISATFVFYDSNSICDEVVFTLTTQNEAVSTSKEVSEENAETNNQVFVETEATVNDTSLTQVASETLPAKEQLIYSECNNGIYIYDEYTYHIEIKQYVSEEPVVTIPSEINGKPVTAIGERAFHNCWYITNVTIPDGVTEIGDRVFGYCTGLTDIKLSNGLEEISFEMFLECTKLNNVVVPESVKVIDGHGFANCFALTNLTLPDSLSKIGYGAFNNCTGFESMIVPAGVTEIDSMAFAYCYNIVSITLPEGLKSIGDYAFYDCTSLININIPDSVEYFGTSVFWRCPDSAIESIPERFLY